MKRTAKKLMSLLLVAIMIFGAAPVGALTDVDFNGLFEINASAATYSGTCGENLTWTLDTETGELVISGTGDMIWHFNAPWDSYRFDIKTVTIGTSVTSIGNDAFHYCDSLTSVTIPESVTSIGVGAFDRCDSLTSVTVDSDNAYYSSDGYGVLFNKDKTELIQYPIGNSRTIYSVPNTVTNIADYSFAWCNTLTSVIIPDSVTEIGSHAFYNCISLTSVTIPESVTSIGEGAFYYCYSLTSVMVDSANTYYSSDEYGVLFNKDETELIQYPIGNTRTTYSIPDSVISIGDCAFYNCTSLTSIKIPENVTRIGNGTFIFCTSLTNITIPESVTRIGNGAFSNCGALTSVTIPDSVTRIGDDAFSGCNSLTSVTIGNSVINIGARIFSWCTCLTSVTIPNSVTKIGENAFYNCTSLTSVIIPESVTSIGDYAFYHCKRLTNVTIGTSVTSIGESAFDYCDSLTDVYYYGTENQWNKISIGLNNYALLNAKHIYTYVVTKHPTCTEKGVKTYICNYCDDSYTEEIPATGHRYESVVTSNTCTAGGYTTHTCSVCEDTYKDNEIPATGHTYERVVTKEASCTTIGIITFTCHCGDSYTDVIKANGHTKGEWEYIDGNEYAKLCTVCGDKLESKMVTVNMFLNGENINKKQLLNKSNSIVTASVTDNLTNNVVFVSSDNSVVSIDKNGIITTNDIGKATITVIIGGTAISDSIEIEVLPRDFTITWIVNGTETKQTVKEYEEIIPKVNTNVEGYMFKGWYSKVPETMPSNNLTFTAVLELIVPISVRIVKAPAKTDYNYKQDNIDISGIELEVTYSDGNKKNIKDTSAITVSGFSNEKRGEQTVTVAYEDLKAEYKVTVKYAWWQWILVILLFGWIWY